MEHVAGEFALAVEHALIREGTRRGLQNYARAVTVAQEAERRRIARDLHDGPAQSLVVLARGLRRIAEEPGDPASADELTSLAQQTLRLVRETIGALRPSLLDDLGLVAALGSLADIQTTESATVELRVTGEQRRLDDHVEVAAYRIAQEALSNWARHADCATVEVELAFAPDSVALRIADRGRGFEESAIRADSFGLMGMRERADLVGGTLAVESSPGGGTEVLLTVPARAARS